MSGNALCDHFLQTNPQSAAEELASRLDCSSMKGEDIVECLRRQTQQDIVKTTNGMAVGLTHNSNAQKGFFTIFFLLTSFILKFWKSSPLMRSSNRLEINLE